MDFVNRFRTPMFAPPECLRSSSLERVWLLGIQGSRLTGRTTEQTVRTNGWCADVRAKARLALLHEKMVAMERNLRCG